MPYNMWFLTHEDESETAADWCRFVREFGEDQQAELTAGTAKDWRQLSVTYTDGSWSFDFERYSVGSGKGPWTDDLSFFRDWLGEAEPAANAQWVAQYLARVQTVYLFRCSINAPDSNLELVREIVDSFRNEGPPGFLYAEMEGWSNEDGQHITWEFSNRVSGLWWMAVRRDGGWAAFRMNLGNESHRRAFRAGKVPTGAERRFYRD